MKLLIDTNWFEIIKDLSVEKQQEVVNAILSYPNGNSDTNIWNKVIKPELEKGQIAYLNKINNLRQYKQQKNNTDTDTRSVADTDTVSSTGTESKEKKRKEFSCSISNLSTTRAKEENKARVHNALEIFGNSFKATDAVVGIFDRPDGTCKQGIQIKNPHLMAFVKKRFDKRTLEKVSDWAVDHNQRGHTYNASALLKLLCKFQSNFEPKISYNSVQSEYLTFGQTKGKKEAQNEQN